MSRHRQSTNSRRLSVDTVAGLGGILQRYRADSVAVADGATITSWAGLVGNTLTPAGTGPTMRTNGIGGHPAAEFTLAGNQRMTSTVTSAVSVLTVCAVVDGALTGQRNIVENNLDLLASTTDWAAYQGFTLTGTADTAAPALIVATYNSTSSTLHRNGTLLATGNTGTNARNAALYVGGHPSLTTRAFEGRIAELIVFSGALSSTDRQTVEAYAIKRYAL